MRSISVTNIPEGYWLKSIGNIFKYKNFPQWRISVLFLSKNDNKIKNHYFNLNFNSIPMLKLGCISKSNSLISPENEQIETLSLKNFRLEEPKTYTEIVDKNTDNVNKIQKQFFEQYYFILNKDEQVYVLPVYELYRTLILNSSFLTRFVTNPGVFRSIYKINELDDETVNIEYFKPMSLNVYNNIGIREHLSWLISSNEIYSVFTSFISNKENTDINAEVIKLKDFYVDLTGSRIRASFWCDKKNKVNWINEIKSFNNLPINYPNVMCTHEKLYKITDNECNDKDKNIVEKEVNSDNSKYGVDLTDTSSPKDSSDIPVIETGSVQFGFRNKLKVRPYRLERQISGQDKNKALVIIKDKILAGDGNKEVKVNNNEPSIYGEKKSIEISGIESMPDLMEVKLEAFINMLNQLQVAQNEIGVKFYEFEKNSNNSFTTNVFGEPKKYAVVNFSILANLFYLIEIEQGSEFKGCSTRLIKITREGGVNIIKQIIKNEIKLF
ncbi:MAG TPA: hypothetical protein QF753_05800, partial [Victivallales bacterium]|nr:hypothetical protein [Victivallales bacterium]